jgi:putative MFS transporter
MFVVGSILVAIGTLLHWPDFLSASAMHYRMVGMPMSPSMLTGMALILLGSGLATYGLIRPRTEIDRTLAVSVRALDGRRLTGTDVRLLAILSIALVIDVMKPATLGFVIPGVSAEYGITVATARYLLLAGLLGTALGSVMWGLLADRIGRRGGLLLAAVLFVGTSICGTMPQFSFNVVMCFLMGLSAGGMLPLVFALIAEIAPSRSRGLIAVLMGGIGSSGGYLAASGAAALLVPAFTWRALWLVGLPTGLLLILFSRFVPESPRFLVLTGRSEAARRTMAAYGLTLEVRPMTVADSRQEAPISTWRSQFDLRTLGLLVFGFAWGLGNFGILTWLPTLVGQTSAGRALGSGNVLLFRSAVIAVPGTVIATLLYARWRTGATMAVLAIVTSAGIVALGVAISTAHVAVPLVGVLTAVMLVGLNGSSATLSVYSAEVFPTVARATGAGAVAAATKLGGLLGPQLVAYLLILGVSAAVSAWMVAIPLGAAAVLLWLRGVETRARSLEEIEATRSQPAGTGSA